MNSCKISSKNQKNHFKESSKKAQVGGPAAVLVAIVGLLIIVYLLFLPPESREEILYGNQTKENVTTETSEGTNLLLESPGRIEPSSMFKKYEDGRNLPDIVLKVSKEATVLKTMNPFYIKNNIFGSSTKDIIFEIQNVDKTEDVLLSFAAIRRSGRLIIKLNGEEIYNNEITKLNPSPIELPKEYLVNRNSLEFSVSSPGIAFWKTNYYNLEDMKITGYVTDVSLQSSESLFDMTSFEKSNIDKESLSFYTECLSDDIGKMRININNVNIAEFVPDCGYARRIDLPPSLFVIGDNKIIFSTEKGKYIIQQIKIVPDFKEVRYPTYYFNIKEKEYNKTQNNSLKVEISIRFTDDSNKEFNFRINNIIKSVDTNDFEYEYLIPKEDLLLGNNAIKIEPVTALEISQLKIEYVKP